VHDDTLTPSRAHWATVAICLAIVWMVFAIVENWPAGPVTPCPYVMEKVEAPAYYVGKYDSHQVMVVKVGGVERMLSCADAKRCPVLPKKPVTLSLTVDACSLEDTGHRLMVYEMRKVTDEGETILFKRK
jgi:hypothetical protein